MSLEVMRLPLRLQILEDRAFLRFQRLNEIHFPGSLTKFKAMAFGKCEELKTITLPSSLSSLEKAFDERYIENMEVSGKMWLFVLVFAPAISRCVILRIYSIIGREESRNSWKRRLSPMPALSEDELLLETDILAAFRLEHVNAICRLVTT